MDPALQQAVERALGTSFQQVSPLAGGDINQAHRVTLLGGREVFIKSNRRAPQTLFSTEAAGLAWLGQANVLSLPEVLAYSEPDAPQEEAFLALEFVPPSPPAPDFDQVLGHQLAALHQDSPQCFGLEYDNFIGTLPQSNSPKTRWHQFYRDNRLAPLLKRAFDQDLFTTAQRQLWDRLLETLEHYTGPDEAPARLHGDLWGGNLLVNQSGAPTLIDPAVYGGHREMDLAMMKLFGGFNPGVFEAYNETFPLDPDHLQRVHLYQLYPLLVHINLFGGHYVHSAMSALSHYN